MGRRDWNTTSLADPLIHWGAARAPMCPRVPRRCPLVLAGWDLLPHATTNVPCAVQELQSSSLGGLHMFARNATHTFLKMSVAYACVRATMRSAEIHYTRASSSSCNAVRIRGALRAPSWHLQSTAIPSAQALRSSVHPMPCSVLGPARPQYAVI